MSQLYDTLKKQPKAPSIAEVYHQQTKYFPESLSSGAAPDPEARPRHFKEYVSALGIDLKPYLEGVFEQDEPHQDEDPGAVDRHATRSRYSRLLFHTAGITDVVETDSGPHYFRAAPSAGALYPTEVYLVTENVKGISDGIHSYCVRNHELVPVWDGAFTTDISKFCLGHAGVGRSRAFLILSSIFQRSAWRYGERAYRRILLDAGHVLGNIVCYAPLEGLRPVTVAGFYDAALNDVLFFDAREEASLLVVPLLEEEDLEKSIVDNPFPGASATRPWDPTQDIEESLMQLLHRRSEIVPSERRQNQRPNKPSLQDPIQTAADALGPVTLRLPVSGKLENVAGVIRERRSTRRFQRSYIPLETLGRVLSFAYEPTLAYQQPYRGIGVKDCVLIDPTMLTSFVVALRVDGLPPGIYQFNPAGPSLHLRKDGSFEAELWNLCLDQQLGRDCAAAVVHTADLAECIDRYGNRAYRYIHLDAGHIGQRLNLAAIGCGVGASGIGGFFDEQANALLDLPESAITAYITLIGPPLGSASF